MENISIGEFIRNKRTEKDLGQKELARLANISTVELWRIETGDRKKVSPSILKALAPHMGVSYEELMKIAGYIPDDFAFNITYIDEEEMPEYYIKAIGLLRMAYDNLNQAEFETMMELIKTYIQTIADVKKGEKS
jgi:transcriptional regulator with XRE-family HTH domain